MTFSLVARCSQTGMLGVAIASSSICVASRCPWVRSGVGASTTQNVTDPSLGNLMLNYLEEGLNVQEAIDKIIENNKFINYRQLSLIDAKGNSASFTGSKILGRHAVSKGVDCIATGNLLSSTNVINSMTDNFKKNSNVHFIERLLLALQAGVDSGGEEGPIHSAGIKVAHENSWPLVDLRIDWTENNPVGELKQLWNTYKPQMEDYKSRATNPDKAPSYGVPGDL